MAETIGTLHQLVTDPRPLMAILAAGTHLLAQLRIHLPDLAAANPDDKVTIPLQVAGHIGALRPATTTAPDLDLTVVFRSAPDPPALFLLRVGKA
ncbi:MAG: hypothetical protein ACRDT0_05180 [Pseudonocardiaceae bacterium]